jgi:hypothetical protein
MMPQIFLGQGGAKCLAARAFLLSPDKSQLNLTYRWVSSRFKIEEA